MWTENGDELRDADTYISVSIKTWMTFNFASSVKKQKCEIDYNNFLLPEKNLLVGRFSKWQKSISINRKSTYECYTSADAKLAEKDKMFS